MERKIDPGLFSIIMASYDNIGREMAIALEKSSWSTILNLARDFSVAIIDSEFHPVAVPEEILPGQALSLHNMIKAMADFFRGEIYDGDVLLSNLPYIGSLHIPEIAVASPVFYKGEIMFWTAVRGHQCDMGAPAATSLYPYTKDLYSEGLKIPPIKVYEKWKERKDVINLYLTNLRYRELTHGDLMAHIAATRNGRDRLLQFLEKYGKETIRTYTQVLFDYTDRMVAAEIRKMKQGTYFGEDWIDTNHYGTRNIPVKVKLTVKDDKWIVDLSECGPQLIGGCNCTMGMTEAAVSSCLGYCIDPQIPKNWGMCKHYEIIAPEGSLVNAQLPGSTMYATTAAGEILYRAILRAAIGACPEMVPAPSAHSRANFVAGTDYREGRNVPFSFFIVNQSTGGGAAYGADGHPCMVNMESAGGMRCISTEMFESLYPVIVEKAELLTDSMGSGKWRGAPGCDWKLRFYDCSPLVFTSGSPGVFNPPFGVLGGKPGIGSCGCAYDSKNPERRIFYSPGLFRMHSSHCWEEWTSGGGGYGDPLERDTELVRIDVKDEFITAATAREEYGVILDQKTYEIDHEVTKDLRNTIRRERGEISLVLPTEPGKALMLSKMMKERDEWRELDRSPDMP